MSSTNSSVTSKCEENNLQKEFAELLRNLTAFERAITRHQRKYENENISLRSEADRQARRIFRYGELVCNKIEEFVVSGKMQEAQHAWHEKICESVRQLATVEAIGAIQAAELVEAGVDCVEDLYLHMNKLTRQQLIGLEYYHDLQLSVPRKEALGIGNAISQAVTLWNSAYSVVLCGEVRRGRSKSQQVDCLLVGTTMLESAIKEIVPRLMEQSLIIDSICCGPTKFTGVCRLKEGSPVRRLSVRVASKSQFPFLLLHHTGPANFTIALARRGLALGLSLCEYAMHRLTTNGGLGEPVEVSSEEEIFELLGMVFVPPEQRGVKKNRESRPEVDVKVPSEA